MNQEQLARGLGWFSIGLGLAQVAMPHRFSRVIGLGNSAAVIRSVGVREVASGVGILAARAPKTGLSARLAGDVMDVSLLALAIRSRGANRNRLAAATAVVGGIAALDVVARQAYAQPPIIRLSLAVNRPASELYGFWRDPANLPRVLKNIESVTSAGDRRWRWVAAGPRNAHLEWDADIVEDRPNELLAWKSVEGASFENEGSLRFDALPTGHGTAVKVEMRYRLPGGAIAQIGAKSMGALSGDAPQQQVWEVLHAFKQIMETGEVATTIGQPAGHRPSSLMHWFESRRQANAGRASTARTQR